MLPGNNEDDNDGRGSLMMFFKMTQIATFNRDDVTKQSVAKSRRLRTRVKRDTMQSGGARESKAATRSNMLCEEDIE